MKSVLGIIALVSCTWPTDVAGDTHYVSPTGRHQWPYTNWLDAATTPRAALQASSANDTVLMSNGVYIVDDELVITQNVTVIGLSGPEVTVVDGRGKTRCFFIDAPKAVVQGICVRSGNPNGAQIEPWAGGGIYCKMGHVRSCIISGSSAYVGGGVACDAGASMTDCVVVSNHSANGGGGIITWGGTVAQSLISHNSDDIGVAGIACGEGATVEQCYVTENEGIGVYLLGSNTVRNCTVVHNRDGVEKGGVMCNEGGTVVNCIVYGNAGCNWTNIGLGWSYLHCCTTLLPPGTGNITNDPQLTPSFHLKSTSPCIDAGSSSNAPATDIDGEARWDHPNHSNVVSIVDIGADEFVDVDLDQMADYWETETFGGTTNSSGGADDDRDDLTDLDEYENGTDPGDADSDDDRMPDGWEVGYALDPLADDGAGDEDADSMSNSGEYAADTDPRNPDSVLRLLTVRPDMGGMRLEWKGGRHAWQFVETRNGLSGSEAWTPVYALPPPTPATNAVIHFGNADPLQFYRIRVER